MGSQQQAWWLCREDPERVTDRCKMVIKETAASTVPPTTEATRTHPSTWNWLTADQQATWTRLAPKTWSAMTSAEQVEWTDLMAFRQPSSTPAIPQDAPVTIAAPTSASTAANEVAYRRYLTTRLRPRADDGTQVTRHFAQVEWETYCGGHRDDRNTCKGWQPGNVVASSAEAAQAERPSEGMSTKKKVIIGSLVGAAIAGAVAACLKSDGCDSGSRVGVDPGHSIFPNTTELLLFGGLNHTVFLGCVNCSEFDATSLLNRFGDYGNRFSSESIFNRYSDYGSRYGNESACNRYASNPPIIVDRAGTAYGRLTLNRHAYQVSNSTIVAWLAGVCESR
jgi:hypothetical protein